MAEAVCPRGHLSDDPEFCSECGLRIAAAAGPDAASGATPPAAPPASASAPAPGGQLCPDCGTPRVPGARFCEVCRHDFSAGGVPAAPKPPVPPFAAPPPAAPRPAAPAAAPAASLAAAPPPPAAPVFPAPLPAFGAEGAAGNLWVVVGRDQARLDADAAPEPDRAYPLDLAENLVGRRNGRRDVHPEIPVADPSVSARHLKICRRADGSLYGVDVGSSNGTLLNGAPMGEGVEAPLRPGDSLALGAWTVLRLEAR